MIARRAYIRRSPLIRKPRRYVVPAEVRAYWEWIREQPCAVPGCGVRRLPPFRNPLMDVAHVGVRGIGQKCSGWEVIPLCRKHHRRGYPQSHHTLGKRFWSFNGLEREQSIRHYKALYFLASPGFSASRSGAALVTKPRFTFALPSAKLKPELVASADPQAAARPSPRPKT